MEDLLYCRVVLLERERERKEKEMSNYGVL